MVTIWMAGMFEEEEGRKKQNSPNRFSSNLLGVKVIKLEVGTKK